MSIRQSLQLLILAVLVVLNAVAALADTPSVLVPSTPRYAVILETSGQVEVKLKDSDWQPGQSGVKLYEEDEIRTGKESSAKILLDENGSTGRLDLKPESRMRLGVFEMNEAREKTTVLDLAIGSVLVKVEKLQGNSKFHVRTPNSISGVRGTEFLVTAKPKESGS